MARSRLQRLKNAAIYFALEGVSRIGASLSLPRARSTGRALGRLAYRVLPRERRKADASIARAFPELDAAERDALIRRMFEHLGVSLLEIAWLPNLTREKLDQTTRFEGLEHLRAGLARGKGVVLFTGHCGNWEWMAAAVALSGFDLSVVARELYDSRINDFIVRMRGHFGMKTIGRGSASAAKELLGALKGGGILGLLIDQSLKAENVNVPFFGYPAPTPVGAAKIAIRAGASAHAIFAERRGDMQVIRIEPPVETTRESDPVELTAEMTAAIEQQIRRAPEQWVWMHERWKER